MAVGYTQHAAISSGGIIRPLIDQGLYGKAKQYIDMYEALSGRFDSLGNIEAGREIFYKSKGLYYLRTDRLDSAEYYLRKELHDGKDFNNQNAASTGLAELYQRLRQPDSVAKYSAYAYAMSDSLYAHRTEKEVERIQAMYNYTRNQEIARRKSEEARQNMQMLSLTFILFVGFVFTVVIIACIYFRKRREGLFLYIQSLEELKKLKAEKAALCQHQEEYSQIILEKDKRIDYLEQRVSRYGKQVYFKTANAERCLRESPLYKVLEQKAIQGHSLDEDDWKKTDILIGEYLPSFDDFLATNLHRLKESERQIMILLRLHFKPVDIAGMTGLSKSQISQNCTEIMKKIFEIKGCSKELIAKLNKIF
jgi:Mg2+ and Co2+ transporter CorA